MVQFSQCIDCKNLIMVEEKIKICKALPEGIPDDIFWNKVMHNKEVEGDHGTIYEDIFSS